MCACVCVWERKLKEEKMILQSKWENKSINNNNTINSKQNSRNKQKTPQKTTPTAPGAVKLIVPLTENPSRPPHLFTPMGGGGSDESVGGWGRCGRR